MIIYYYYYFVFFGFLSWSATKLSFHL
jgi:hypothetical protein